MLSSYPVNCPHENCDWTGNVVPSRLRGGADAEIASKERAWFKCPRCRRDWEVRIINDRVTTLPARRARRLKRAPGRSLIGPPRGSESINAGEGALNPVAVTASHELSE